MLSRAALQQMKTGRRLCCAMVASPAPFLGQSLASHEYSGARTITAGARSRRGFPDIARDGDPARRWRARSRAAARWVKVPPSRRRRGAFGKTHLRPPSSASMAPSKPGTTRPLLGESGFPRSPRFRPAKASFRPPGDGACRPPRAFVPPNARTGKAHMAGKTRRGSVFPLPAFRKMSKAGPAFVYGAGPAPSFRFAIGNRGRSFLLPNSAAAV